MATVYAAWVDDNRIYFNKSTNDGGHWELPAIIDDGNVAGYTRHSPKIQVDADGDIYVCWLRKKTFGQMQEVLVINHSEDGGDTWSGTHDVSDVPGADMTEYLGFIIDSAGYLWVFFGRQNWAPGVWYYKSTNVKDYDTWDNEVYITHSGEPSSQIEACLCGNGWIWIVYRVAVTDIFCHCYDGARWIRHSNPIAASTLGPACGICADNTHVFVTFYKTSTNLAYTVQRSNGGWQPPGGARIIAEEQWPSIGGCELWAMTVGTDSSMEVNQRDSDDGGINWGAPVERSQGEGAAENITGHRAVDYAHAPYGLFVMASHKIFCYEGTATE